ncbi:hypothetical protein E8E14_007267 [Neopestalotiopsis sp. 37M]|nr:hypothetical protein E8E14_007267 [Neopestalotiopsis sp. 37M]
MIATSVGDEQLQSDKTYAAPHADTSPLAVADHSRIDPACSHEHMMVKCDLLYTAYTQPNTNNTKSTLPSARYGTPVRSHHRDIYPSSLKGQQQTPSISPSSIRPGGL